MGTRRQTEWIVQVGWKWHHEGMWRTRLEKLICDGNKFILNAFMYLQPMQRLENLVRIGGPGSSNNGTTKRILNALKTI